MPDPGLGVVLPAQTTMHGNANLPIAIPDDPALVGARLYMQWAIICGGQALG